MDPGGPPPKKGKGPLFWIATGCFGCLTMVALVIGLIAGGIYFMGKGSVDVVDQFLSDVRLGKMDDAYGRLSQDYRARLSQGAFENAVAEHPALKDSAEGRFDRQRSRCGQGDPGLDVRPEGERRHRSRQGIRRMENHGRRSRRE
jgi:hypothetical protein